MFTKFSLSIVLVALMLSIPGIARLVAADGSPPVPALTPGTADAGVLEVSARVAFWEDRITGPHDHLNRVQLSTTLLEQARQTGDPAVYRRALAVADDAVRANPAGLDARIARAAALAADHRFDEAIAEVGAVLEREPSSFQAHAIAGDGHLELGRYEEARHHLDQLILRQPDAPAALARQAEFAWDTGDPADALGFARRALDRANAARLPAGELSYYANRLARYHLDTGDIAGARALADATLAIAPHIPAVHATVGHVRLGAGDLVGAESAYLAAVGITPIREAVVGLVDVYARLGDAERESSFRTLLDAMPAPFVAPA